MRYYTVQITGSDGSNLATFSTLANGATNGSALKLEIEVFQTFFATPAQNSYIRLTGIDYSYISQAQNLNNAQIKVYAGMSKGLPLANVQPIPGLIVQGYIFQAFANWQGTQVTLDLIVLANGSSDSTPKNLSGKWVTGSDLTSNVKQALTNAYPGIAVIGSFSPNLVLPQDIDYACTNLEQFASTVNLLSLSFQFTNYAGANIAYTPGGFVLSDGTVDIPTTNSYSNPLNITQFDIIGNLTWIDINTIQAKVVMRSDLTSGQYITFPQGFPIASNSNSFNSFRDNVSFQGVFYVNLIHHSGNSRQPDANSWVTIINASVAYPPQ